MGVNDIKVKFKIMMVNRILKVRDADGNKRFTIKILGSRYHQGIKFYDIAYTDTLKNFTKRFFLTEEDILLYHKVSSLAVDFLSESL